uniref:Peptidase C1A papain C-terminal domain-containing protein n=3 Tax=Meloidogyne TaxID=189290 RepID=A0A6V7X4E0_MELEN|nr:unnamed protein product [Meloidogyne enterolobii]
MNFLWFITVVLSSLILNTFQVDEFDIFNENFDFDFDIDKDLESFVESFNLQDFTWKAKINEKFANMSADSRKLLCGVNSKAPKTPASTPNFKTNSKIRSKRSNPSCTYNIEFDSRKQWPQCADIINIIRNQGQCGDCWAVASSSVFTDRYCIERAKKGLKTNVSDPYNQLSDEDILSCTSPTSRLVA